MSNRKWRKPAGGDAGAHHSDTDASKPEEPALTSTSGARLRPDQPEQIAQARQPGPGPEIAVLPDDYLENGYDGGQAELPPGCYRTKFQGGDGLADLRATVDGVYTSKPLTDAEVEAILGETVRFLRQVMVLTASVTETIPAGELRRVVASECALPGDVVLEDGSISRYRDAYRVGEDGARSTAPEQEPSKPADHKAAPRSRSRGATHPLMALLRLAVQAARLIKQITSGTHPGIFNKLKREPKGPYDDVMAGEKALRALMNGT
ncbi:MAG: hypothetical protein H6839_12230 [Planctomycetes bacterium]|nr:hypothetical protein [Planctomycetota bacterium]